MKRFQRNLKKNLLIVTRSQREFSALDGSESVPCPQMFEPETSQRGVEDLDSCN